MRLKCDIVVVVVVVVVVVGGGVGVAVLSIFYVLINAIKPHSSSLLYHVRMTSSQNHHTVRLRTCRQHHQTFKHFLQINYIKQLLSNKLRDSHKTKTLDTYRKEYKPLHTILGDFPNGVPRPVLQMPQHISLFSNIFYRNLVRLRANLYCKYKFQVIFVVKAQGLDRTLFCEGTSRFFRLKF